MIQLYPRLAALLLGILTIACFLARPQHGLDRTLRQARAREAPLVHDEVHTFSIVALDPDKKEWGVAVASKYLAVGSVVPWAKAGVGAVATQAQVNATYGPRGLELLEKGKSADEVVKVLTDDDKGKDSRQLGVVDAKGEIANF